MDKSMLKFLSPEALERLRMQYANKTGKTSERNLKAVEGELYRRELKKRASSDSE